MFEISKRVGIGFIDRDNKQTLYPEIARSKHT